MRKTESISIRNGINRDSAEMLQPEGTVVSALNATYLTMNGNEGIFQNDMGNARVEAAYLPAGFVPVGMTEFGGVVYVASYNPLTKQSQIGSYPSPERNISSDEVGAPVTALGDFGKFYDADDNPKVSEYPRIDNVAAKLQLTTDVLRPGDKFSVEITDAQSLGRLLRLVQKGVYSLGFAVINDAGQLQEIPGEDLVGFYKYRIDATNDYVAVKDDDADGVMWEDYIPSPILLQEEGSAVSEINNFKSRKFNIYKQNLVGHLYLTLQLNVPDIYRIVPVSKPSSDNGQDVWFSAPQYLSARSGNVTSVFASNAAQFYYICGWQNVSEKIPISSIITDTTTIALSNCPANYQGVQLSTNQIHFDGDWRKSEEQANSITYERSGVFYADVNKTRSRIATTVTRTITWDGGLPKSFLVLNPEKVPSLSGVLKNGVSEDLALEGVSRNSSSTNGTTTHVLTYKTPEDIYYEIQTRSSIDVANATPDILLIPSCYVATLSDIDLSNGNVRADLIAEIRDKQTYNHIILPYSTVENAKNLGINPGNQITQKPLYYNTLSYYAKASAQTSTEIISGCALLNLDFSECYYDALGGAIVHETNNNTTGNLVGPLSAGADGWTANCRLPEYGYITVTYAPIYKVQLEEGFYAGILTYLQNTVTIDLSKLNSNTFDVFDIRTYVTGENCKFTIDGLEYLQDGYALSNVKLELQDLYNLYPTPRNVDPYVIEFGERTSYSGAELLQTVKADVNNDPVDASHGLYDQRLVEASITYEVAQFGITGNDDPLRSKKFTLIISSTYNNVNVVKQVVREEKSIQWVTPCTLQFKEVLSGSIREVSPRSINLPPSETALDKLQIWGIRGLYNGKAKYTTAPSPFKMSAELTMSLLKNANGTLSNTRTLVWNRGITPLQQENLNNGISESGTFTSEIGIWDAASGTEDDYYTYTQPTQQEFANDASAHWLLVDKGLGAAKHFYADEATSTTRYTGHDLAPFQVEYPLSVGHAQNYGRIHHVRTIGWGYSRYQTECQRKSKRIWRTRLEAQRDWGDTLSGNRGAGGEHDLTFLYDDMPKEQFIPIGGRNWGVWLDPMDNTSPDGGGLSDEVSLRNDESKYSFGATFIAYKDVKDKVSVISRKIPGQCNLNTQNFGLDGEPQANPLGWRIGGIYGNATRPVEWPPLCFNVREGTYRNFTNTAHTAPMRVINPGGTWSSNYVGQLRHTPMNPNTADKAWYTGYRDLWKDVYAQSISTAQEDAPWIYIKNYIDYPITFTYRVGITRTQNQLKEHTLYLGKVLGDFGTPLGSLDNEVANRCAYDELLLQFSYTTSSSYASLFQADLFGEKPTASGVRVKKPYKDTNGNEVPGVWATGFFSDFVLQNPKKLGEIRDYGSILRTEDGLVFRYSAKSCRITSWTYVCDGRHQKQPTLEFLLVDDDVWE